MITSAAWGGEWDRGRGGRGESGSRSRWRAGASGCWHWGWEKRHGVAGRGEESRGLRPLGRLGFVRGACLGPDTVQRGRGGPHGPVGIRKRCPRVRESKKLLPPNHRRYSLGHRARGLWFRSTHPFSLAVARANRKAAPMDGWPGIEGTQPWGASVRRKTNPRVGFAAWTDRKAQADLCPPPRPAPATLAIASWATFHPGPTLSVPCLVGGWWPEAWPGLGAAGAASAVLRAGQPARAPRH